MTRLMKSHSARTRLCLHQASIALIFAHESDSSAVAQDTASLSDTFTGSIKDTFPKPFSNGEDWLYQPRPARGSTCFAVSKVRDGVSTTFGRYHDCG